MCVTVLPVFDSGWILSISVIGTNLAVAVIMMVVAGFFTVNAVLAVILLKMVSLCSTHVGFLLSRCLFECQSVALNFL